MRLIKRIKSLFKKAPAQPRSMAPMATPAGSCRAAAQSSIARNDHVLHEPWLMAHASESHPWPYESHRRSDDGYSGRGGCSGGAGASGGWSDSSSSSRSSSDSGSSSSSD